MLTASALLWFFQVIVKVMVRGFHLQAQVTLSHSVLIILPLPLAVFILHQNSVSP
jgi:hypothetical protein